MRTLTNSVHHVAIPHNTARSTAISLDENDLKKMRYTFYLEITTCDPSIYTMDHPKFQQEKFIDVQNRFTHTLVSILLWYSALGLGKTIYLILIEKLTTLLYILTHTSNAKCFRNLTLINIRGLAEIIVPFRGYGRYSPNQVMIKKE